MIMTTDRRKERLPARPAAKWLGDWHRCGRALKEAKAAKEISDAKILREWPGRGVSPSSQERSRYSATMPLLANLIPRGRKEARGTSMSSRDIQATSHAVTQWSAWMH